MEIDRRAALRRRSSGGRGGTGADSAGVGLGRARGGADEVEGEVERLWARGWRGMAGSGAGGGFARARLSSSARKKKGTGRNVWGSASG